MLTQIMFLILKLDANCCEFKYHRFTCSEPKVDYFLFGCSLLSHVYETVLYRYLISWEALLDPSDSYFQLADLVGFYTHWTYMHIFRHLFISNHWWQNSDISSQSSYCYAILWEVFLDPSDSYFLFADLVGFYTHCQDKNVSSKNIL
jgi:hypothetical protein